MSAKAVVSRHRSFEFSLQWLRKSAPVRARARVCDGRSVYVQVTSDSRPQAPGAPVLHNQGDARVQVGKVLSLFSLWFPPPNQGDTSCT